jgi:hypothetical protein
MPTVAICAAGRGKFMSRRSSDRKNAGIRAHSRRAFLKGLGAAGLTVSMASAAAGAPRIPDVLSGPGVLNLRTRPAQAFG